MKIEAKKIKWNAVAGVREMLIWLVILVVTLIMGAKQFFTPLSKKVESARSQVLAKQMELEAYKKFLKGGNTANKKSLEGMDLNKQAMAQKVKDAFTKVNMSPDVVESELLSALTNPAYAKAALLEKFNFVGEKKQAGYSEMNIDLKITGTYNGISQYLSFIRQLPYLIRIDSIAIGNKDGNNNQAQVELSAKAVLYVGEPKTAEQLAQANSRSDMATDLLMEITGGKAALTPFSAQPRDMTNWSIHELKLTSTMAGGARPTALINGKVFTVGDDIADFKLMEVRPREVVLQRGDVQHVLKIEEDSNYGPSQSTVITKGPESNSFNAPVNSGNLNQELANKNENHPEAVENSENVAGNGQAPTGISEQDGGKSGTTAIAGAAGTGNAASNSGTNPQAVNPEDTKKFSENIHGTFNNPNDKEQQVQAQEEPSAHSQEPGSDNTKQRLNPNEVEDVEGVPFEDLEEVVVTGSDEV